MHNYQRSTLAAAAALMLAAAWTPATKAVADAPSYYEPPKFKTQVKPNYPESARAAHETGTVFVKVLVEPNGTAKQVMIAKSSGHKDLDDEVLRVAKESTYVPAMRDGKPTMAFYDFSYSFTLSGLAETAAATSASAQQLASNPKNVSARMALIEANINKRDYAKAESVADEGVKLLPSDARLWSARGAAYYSDASDNDNSRLSAQEATSKAKVAADSYEQAVKLDPKAASPSVAAAAYALYGFHLWASQSYAECIPYADKALGASPKNFQYLMLKGDCQSGQGDYKAAIGNYQSAAQYDDKKNSTISSRLYASLGLAQLNSGDESAGMQSMMQAEKIDPKAPYAYQNTATYYITKNPPNYNAALTPLIQLAQVQPTNVQAQVNIGDIYTRQKNYKAAQEAYTKALQIDPKSGDAQFGLAEIAASQGDVKSIDGPLQKAIALSPGSAALYNTTISQLLIGTNSSDRLGDAARYADAATKADPNSAWAWYTMGIVYADQQKKDQANSALRKAFDLFKAKNDQVGMNATNQQFMTLNGKDNSLITGSGRSQTTNQSTSPGS
ncbi:MAG: TonB family protein [Candidatus Eremiobacteraeota bacterium]|nr:TonB family protein [Candidatus Eremiobacteraeota bacterium]